MPTSLLALCGQSDADATLETPIRARSRSKARPKVCQIFDERDPASPLDRHHPILE
jgi:hypothetical protein